MTSPITQVRNAIAGQWLRWVAPWLRRLARGVNHADVVEHVHDDGIVSGQYVLMIVLSCAIATLGLLLSSPAVIIGAMLISPLMGPIMLLGFSLSTLNLSLLRRALITLGWGVAAALAISMAIVWLSPLTEATPEILARTRPNFFDLLVAIFSGLAGGYAVIRRKGETIVGVAIATALMPPLAVTGYGLAAGSMAAASGSFFLFMTNLLAIAVTVAILSRVFGFGGSGSRKNAMLQAGFVFLIFAALSIPLGFALRDIAYETRAMHTVTDAMLEPFEGKEARVGDVAIAFPRDGSVRVDATVLTKTRVADAETMLAALLETRLKKPVQVNLDQVLVNEDRSLERAEFLRLAESSLAAPIREDMSRLETLAQSRQTEAELRNAVPIALAGADINAETRTAAFFAKPDPAYSVAAYRALEAGLQANFPDWAIAVHPPVQELPLIIFDEGGDVLNETTLNTIHDCVWALERWDVASVEVVGFASTAGESQRFNNRALARRRADAVAGELAGFEINAIPVGEYRAYRQREDEIALGQLHFQSVLIRPAAD